MIKKFAWVLLAMGLSSTLLYAAPQMADEKASATQTATGCLQKGTEPVGFFLISSDEKHWELYPDSGVSLAEHVGHTVTVTGTVAKRSKAQEEKSQPHEKKETGEKQHGDLKVSSVKMVSETCSK